LLALLREASAAPSTGALSRVVAAGLPELVAARSVRLLFHDADGDLLWREERDGSRRSDSAAAGILSFVLRSASPVRVETLAGDPRFDPELDLAGAGGDGGAGAAGRSAGAEGSADRLLAVPVRDSLGRAVAVLAAWRPPAEPPFDAADGAVLDRSARLLAPALERLALESQLARETRAPSFFRQEALEHQGRGRDTEGRLLEVSPVWLRRGSLLLVTLCVAAFAFVALVSYDEYETGPAVVQTAPAAVGSAGVGSRGDGEAGTEAAGAAHAGDGARVIALLPGRLRPQLHEGMPARLELSGYPNVFQSLQVERIGDRVLAPEQARRRLPGSIAEAVPIAEPSVVVEARLPAPRFVAGGERYAYYDGMLGRLEVHTGRRRLIVSLLPWLENVFAPPAREAAR
ncbi:MAG TPA: hypothetical protein VHQ65_03965, partial [Thermoanaerobaculia bacterium]|nr:hypothetical protein [Thermoanaerobaculia bacterium]